MNQGIRRVASAFLDTCRSMCRHETPRDAAAISYFGLVALFPAIFVLIALVDAFLGWLDVHKSVVQRIVALFPGSRQFLTATLAEIAAPSVPVLLSCLILVAWSSTLVFTFMESAMNRIWGVPRCRTFWQSRLRSTSLLILGGICLLSWAGVTAVLSAARSRATARMSEFAKLPIIHWLGSSILLGAGFLIAVVVFSSVYKLMPDRRVQWREAVSGGVVSALAWEAGSYIFVKLVPRFDYQRIYGKTGAIIALLAWVYTSNLILLFGASFSAKLNRTDSPKQEGSGNEHPVACRGRQDRIRAFPKSL